MYIMFTKFKIFNRPIAPHLLIYTPQLSSLFSIWHRISGVSLTIFFSIFLIFIKIFLISNMNWAIFISSTILKWVMIYFYLLALLLLIYHLFNGIRHIVWDLGFFLNINYLWNFSLLTFTLIFLTLIYS